MKLQKIFLIAISMLCFSASAQVAPPCVTDLNRDGITNSDDLNLFTASWGPCKVGQACPTDFNGDRITSQNDFSRLLLNYGRRCNVVIFNVSNASYSNGLVNIPVTISSDLKIVAIDFALQFDEQRLTYKKIVPVFAPPAVEMMDYFHPIDRTLRYTSNTLDLFPNDNQLFNIQFSTSLGKIESTDLHIIRALLNGASVNYILK